MERKTIGTVLGVAGLFLWFMPFVYVSFMGVEAYQTGQHIGGMAYLLLAASLAYAVFSWREVHVPRLISAGVSLGICTIFLIQAGQQVAWGLILFLIVSLIGAFLAFRDNKIQRQKI